MCVGSTGESGSASRLTTRSISSCSRQEAVSLLCSLLQDVEHPGAVTEVRIGGDADVARDRVGGHEADAENIGGQLIGVLRDDLDSLVAVLFIDLHGIGGRDIVAAQEQHDLLDGLLRGPGFLDHGHALFANAGDLDQAGARVLDDVERLQTEVRHDPPGRHRADALDEPAAQVFFQPGECGWFGFLGVETLELPTIFEVLAPVAGEAQCLASMNVWKATHDGDEVAFPRCFEPGDGVAGVFGVIGDALDDALQVFCRRLWRSIGLFAR